MVYWGLLVGIATEVIATLLLKASDGWEKWQYGLGAVALYTVSGFCIGYVLKYMSVGATYTIWSGVGIALVCVLSVLIWGQKFDFYSLAGIFLIFIGSALITLKSNVLMQ